MNFHGSGLSDVLHRWHPKAGAQATVWSVAVYCLVVTLMVMAVALIADMPLAAYIAY